VRCGKARIKKKDETSVEIIKQKWKKCGKHTKRVCFTKSISCFVSKIVTLYLAISECSQYRGTLMSKSKSFGPCHCKKGTETDVGFLDVGSCGFG
jgi:hypothetical protein